MMCVTRCWSKLKIPRMHAADPTHISFTYLWAKKFDGKARHRMVFVLCVRCACRNRYRASSSYVTRHCRANKLYWNVPSSPPAACMATSANGLKLFSVGIPSAVSSIQFRYLYLKHMCAMRFACVCVCVCVRLRSCACQWRGIVKF